MVFGNSLSSYEVDYCDWLRTQLAAVEWARPLLTKLPGRADLDSTHKALLFELRFAGELHRLGLTAEYEFRAGVGSSTVDFRVVEGDRDWLVELVSIAPSMAVHRATHENGGVFHARLSTDAEDPTQSEEGEILLVQQKIGEKVFHNGRPTKFA